MQKGRRIDRYQCLVLFPPISLHLRRKKKPAAFSSNLDLPLFCCDGERFSMPRNIGIAEASGYHSSFDASMPLAVASKGKKDLI